MKAFELGYIALCIFASEYNGAAVLSPCRSPRRDWSFAKARQLAPCMVGMVFRNGRELTPQLATRVPLLVRDVPACDVEVL